MYICRNNKRKQQQMKTTANELKVGMTVKYANVWIKIETIEQRTQKNGVPFVQVFGTQQAGTIKRSCGHKSQVSECKIDVSFKNTTKVTTK